MRYADFVVALDNAGWEGVHDAQHSQIETLWRAMFPSVADVEDELEDALADALEMRSEIPNN